MFLARETVYIDMSLVARLELEQTHLTLTKVAVSVRPQHAEAVTLVIDYEPQSLLPDLKPSLTDLRELELIRLRAESHLSKSIFAFGWEQFGSS